MASNPDVSERNSACAWLLVTIPKALKTFLEMIAGIKASYNVIHWEEFSLAVDQYAAKIDAMLVTCFGMPELSPALLEQMTKLKAVVTVTSGTDHLDLPLLRKYNIKVYSGGGVNNDACADMAFNLLLAAARRNAEVIPLSNPQSEATSISEVLEKVLNLLAYEVTGSTLGIVGLGNIGYEVARRAIGFKMKTLYCSRRRRGAADENEVKATYCSSMDELLPQVDFLVLSAAVTEETRHMMDRKQFQMMKSNAIIINVARGELIDHDALIDALQSGTIAGAALDVTEPAVLPVDHPLLHMPNVLVTPHCSAFTADVGKRSFRKVMENLSNALS